MAVIRAQAGFAELPLSMDGDLARLFHRNTRLTAANLLEFEERIRRCTADTEWLYPWIATRPAAPRVSLPRRRRWWGLDRLIRSRRTVRRFGSRPLGLGMLSRLLFNAAGITSRSDQDNQRVRWPLRAAPSAGALYPLECRLAALNVSGVQRGVYRYQPADHCLERLSIEVPTERLKRASLHEDLVSGCSVVIGLIADWRRLVLKYGDRGYRFVLLEAGHAAQNILLTGTALGLAVVPVGGFVDEEVAGIFGCNACDQEPLYLIIVGC